MSKIEDCVYYFSTKGSFLEDGGADGMPCMKPRSIMSAVLKIVNPVSRYKDSLEVRADVVMDGTVGEAKIQCHKMLAKMISESLLRLNSDTI